ncbi:MAG: urate hydroxylase PuuD [Gammaproteobacteria bacterium]|nr:urate hydroxylase PuuD [Gammaproteobacteria bacterium]MDH3372455.1 urate hydroxylase PuuD [Gammaproteobacteria bacterium]MDH3407890.1 urate hydroxylase PuuD [Gammaproteobacteria bacterium]MDH3551341.1 urate hydroxylase PuuD [Gammaproteobacteria bacterium]
MNPLNSVAGTIIGGIILAVVIGLATMGVSFNTGSFIIWVHVMAGITWIGLLYYFNFVQVPALGEAASDEGGPGGAGITKYVAPRALWWFRWGALLTWLSGAAYLAHLRIFDDAFALGLMGENVNTQAMIIGIGAWLGTIMLFNVWVLIWPNQKKILGMVEASADEIGKARRVAFLASRTNTLLSIPMLMSMVGYGHGGFFV